MELWANPKVLRERLRTTGVTELRGLALYASSRLLIDTDGAAVAG